MNEFKCAVIICDFDGKIKDFDKNAEFLFNYLSKDVINIKRIYNLLHPDFVLDFANELNLFLNKKILKLKHNVVCLQSNNAMFYGILTLVRGKDNLLKVRIEKKECVVISNKKSLTFDKINLILRSKFVLGSLIPFLFAIIWSIYRFNFVEYKLIFLILIAICLLHVCANTFNDYFDWKSGRDRKNVDYVLFSTGGSRAIDFKFISEKHLLLISILCLSIVILLGSYFVYLRGFVILFIGLCGIFSVYFYSAPPIHLASRYGLGELMHIICLGPLIIAGTAVLLSGKEILFSDFWVGIPFGLLITGCLLMNEYPDSKFDKLSGKMNLAVILGEKYIPHMYITLQLLSFISVCIGMYFFNFPVSFFFIFIIIPYSIKTAKIVLNIKLGRTFITQSCINSFFLYVYFSFILIFSLILNIIYMKIYP